jgi:hypothetical protein
MSALLDWIKKELREVLPAVIFFLVAFNLICFTEDIMLEESGVRYTSFLGATIGALVAGKVLLAVDLLPFLDRFRGRPLIYGTLWKASLYSLAAFLFRVGEHLVPWAVKEGGLAAGSRHMLATVEWPRFWAIQVWITSLLLVFVAVREVVVAVGTLRVRRMFFGS